MCVYPTRPRVHPCLPARDEYDLEPKGRHLHRLPAPAGSHICVYTYIYLYICICIHIHDATAPLFFSAK